MDSLEKEEDVFDNMDDSEYVDNYKVYNRD
jgi:hypothetical protein